MFVELTALPQLSQYKTLFLLVVDILVLQLPQLTSWDLHIIQKYPSLPGIGIPEVLVSHFLHQKGSCVTVISIGNSCICLLFIVKGLALLIRKHGKHFLSIQPHSYGYGMPNIIKDLLLINLLRMLYGRMFISDKNIFYMQKGIIVHTAIVDNGGRVLILKRAAANDVLPGYWDIPGGTLEDGEDPSAGAIREAKEETGLDIMSPKLFFQRSNIDAAKNTQFITLVFRSKYPGGDIVLNPAEHEEYTWLAPDGIAGFQTVEYLLDCLYEL